MLLQLDTDRRATVTMRSTFFEESGKAITIHFLSDTAAVVLNPRYQLHKSFLFRD